MPINHLFDPPDRFVAGTVGEPGSRTFFLQARESSRLISVSCEKQQVVVLAERIDELLDQLMQAEESEAGDQLIPAMAPISLADNSPLDQPIEEEFRAGTMTLAWDPSDGRIVIEVFPFSPDAVIAPDQDESDYTEPEPDEVLTVRLEPGAARAFVQRAGSVVEAGRPTCPFCGNPMDPEGHLCVRANGFKRRDP